MGARTVLVIAAEGAAIALAVVLFGIPLWVPVLLALVIAGLVFRNFGALASVFVGNICLGAYFAAELFGIPPTWAFALIGVVAIIAIFTHLATPRGGGDSSMNATSGDQNPIPIMLMVVALRFWLAFYDASSTPITDTSPGLLDLITIFVFGVIPSFPIFVNVLLFLATNGALILWLSLLVKRNVSLVAN